MNWLTNTKRFTYSCSILEEGVARNNGNKNIKTILEKWHCFQKKMCHAQTTSVSVWSGKWDEQKNKYGDYNIKSRKDGVERNIGEIEDRPRNGNGHSLLGHG